MKLRPYVPFNERLLSLLLNLLLQLGVLCFQAAQIFLLLLELRKRTPSVA
jgi:hypothetical protein